MKAIYFFVIFFSLVSANFCLAGETEAESESPSKGDSACQDWEKRKSFIEDYSKLSIIGSTGEVPDTYWKAASTNIDHFSHREKVKHIFLNHGYISGASLACLAHFPNVEEVTLGINIEGVTVPPNELRSLLKFTKLKYLHIALHGLENKHFKVIGELKSLEELYVEFGALEMIGTDKAQMDRWSPVNVDDEAILDIVQIKSLEQLVVRWPNPKDGKIAFSEKALTALLSSPTLKFSVRIDSRNFTKEGLEAIKKISLPKHVEIYIESMSQWK